MGQLAWQLFRGSTILEYEIPKWESEPFAPNLLVPLSEEVARAKIDHLAASFPSQQGKPWYDSDLFGSTLRLRGVQHGQSRHAEGFVARKLALEPGPGSD